MLTLCYWIQPKHLGKLYAAEFVLVIEKYIWKEEPLMS